MRTLLNDIFHLVFPELCVECNDILTENEEQICLSCLCKLPRILFLCEDTNPVAQLFAGRIPFVHATAFFRYLKKSEIPHLTYLFKYCGNKQLAYQLGRQAALALQIEHNTCLQVDMLIPVPLHPKKEKKRGYNQSERICRGLSSVWNIPVRTDILQRKKHTLTQTDKTLYGRWQNMQEVFCLTNPEALEGQHVLLVDDVITSGSTLISCAKTLRGVADVRISIFGLSLA